MNSTEKMKLVGGKVPESLWAKFRIKTLNTGITVAKGMEKALELYVAD